MSEPEERIIQNKVKKTAGLDFLPFVQVKGIA